MNDSSYIIISFLSNFFSSFSITCHSFFQLMNTVYFVIIYHPLFFNKSIFFLPLVSDNKFAYQSLSLLLVVTFYSHTTAKIRIKHSRPVSSQNQKSLS